MYKEFKKYLTNYTSHEKMKLEAKEMVKIIVGLLVGLCIGCSVHNYNLRPELNYLIQDNGHILICRVDAQGGKICESTLEFFKDQKLFVVPLKDWSNE